MRRICDMEPSQRPRERLLQTGAESLSDAELLAVLLRTGRQGQSAVALAHALLADEGGLTAVARLQCRELTRRAGFGPAKAASVLAAMELGRRLAREQMINADRLDQPRRAGEYLVHRLKTERREIFGFIGLDTRNRFVSLHELSRGSRSHAQVEPSELYRLAVIDDAAGVLIFHNHPSGDPTPSSDDLRLTRRLLEAGTLIGVPLVDHLIVSGAEWVSLRSANPELFRP